MCCFAIALPALAFLPQEASGGFTTCSAGF